MRSSMPLDLRGALVEDLELEFKGGEIVEVRARTGRRRGAGRDRHGRGRPAARRARAGRRLLARRRRRHRLPPHPARRERRLAHRVRRRPAVGARRRRRRRSARSAASTSPRRTSTSWSARRSSRSTASSAAARSCRCCAAGTGSSRSTDDGPRSPTGALASGDRNPGVLCPAAAPGGGGRGTAAGQASHRATAPRRPRCPAAFGSRLSTTYCAMAWISSSLSWPPKAGMHAAAVGDLLDDRVERDVELVEVRADVAARAGRGQRVARGAVGAEQRGAVGRGGRALAAPCRSPVSVAPVSVAPVSVAPVSVAPVSVAPVSVAPVSVAPVSVAPVSVPSSPPPRL